MLVSGLLRRSIPILKTCILPFVPYHPITSKQLYDEDSSHFKSPEMARATFIQEMEAMSRLRHPNIILFLGATDSLTPIIVTEYAARGALDKLLSTK